MTTVYAIAFAVGVVGLITWIAAGASSAMVGSWKHLDPEARFGRPGRSVLAFLLGFGLAGLSATYADWSLPLSLGGAVVGGAAMVVVAVTILAPEPEES